MINLVFLKEGFIHFSYHLWEFKDIKLVKRGFPILLQEYIDAMKNLF